MITHQCFYELEIWRKAYPSSHIQIRKTVHRRATKNAKKYQFPHRHIQFNTPSESIACLRGIQLNAPLRGTRTDTDG